MAQTKFNCTNCRRLIDLHLEKCPFCGTPNNNVKNKSTTNNSARKPASAARPVQRMQNISVDEMNSLFTDEEIEEQIVIPTTEPEPPTIVSNIDDEEYEEYVPTDIENEENEENEEDKEEKQVINKNNEKAKSTEEFTETLQATSKRKKINWTDEERKEEPDYSKMYDENGRYNANFDGYYNDTLPKIANEIDHVLAGREKAILKAIFTIVAIIAIILYLILTI